MTAAGSSVPPTPAPGGDTATSLAGMRQDIDTVIVAVHGIGEPKRFETIETVARAFCKYAGTPAAIPLGWFHLSKEARIGYLSLRDQSPPFPPVFRELAFVECYWADIPRELNKEGFHLEEAKQWSSKIVQRLSVLRREKVRNDGEISGHARTRELRRINSETETISHMVGEIVEGVAVVERLLRVFKYMGLPPFKVREILDAFLGDVQVVAEFEEARKEILARFIDVFEKIHESNPRADIHIVAHSEGTVVAFLGLLEAMTRDEPPAWLKQVRGVMTIGSPIDKHIYMWPHLWTPHERAAARLLPAKILDEDAAGNLRRIPWQNYYDFGDPVAFRLEAARQWMADTGWDQVFDFKDSDDHGFTRYYLPGQAHLDYWNDELVFGHYIQNVVCDGRSAGCAPREWQPPDGAKRFAKAPRTNFVQDWWKFHTRDWRVGLVSRSVPYLLTFLVLLAAVGALYVGVRKYLDPVGELFERPLESAGNVLGFACLLGGVSLVARLGRLNRAWTTFLCSMIPFLLGLIAFFYTSSPRAQHWLTSPFIETIILTGGDTEVEQLKLPWFPGRYPPAGIDPGGKLAQWLRPSIIIAESFAIMLLAWLFNFWKPRWGARTLLIPGALLIALIIAHGVFTHRADPVPGVGVAGPMRPTVGQAGDGSTRTPGPAEPIAAKGSLVLLLLCVAAFLYLWWLALVLFDLTFVWHRFIRSTGKSAERYLRELT